MKILLTTIQFFGRNGKCSDLSARMHMLATPLSRDRPGMLFLWSIWVAWTLLPIFGNGVLKFCLVRDWIKHLTYFNYH